MCKYYTWRETNDYDDPKEGNANYDLSDEESVGGARARQGRQKQVSDFVSEDEQLLDLECNEEQVPDLVDYDEESDEDEEVLKWKQQCSKRVVVAPGWGWMYEDDSEEPETDIDEENM